VLGFFSREPSLPPPLPGIDQKAPDGRIYENLRESLAGRYAIRDFRSFSDIHPVPDDIVGLIVARPEGVTPEELAEIDAYLKRGGHILLVMDQEAVSPQPDLPSNPLNTGMDDWLNGFGVQVHKEFIYDERCKSFAVDNQKVTLADGSQINNPIYAPYGFLLQLQLDSLNASHVVTSGLDLVEMIWAHPVTFKKEVGLNLESETLLSSSSQAHALPPASNLEMNRDNIQLLEILASRSGEAQRFDVAIAVSGSFAADAPAGLLVVIGDSEVFHNITLEGGSANATFADNLMDWLAQDESLIRLRSRGRKQRPLRNFYLEAVEAAGGPKGTDSENRALDREARDHRDTMERKIAWANVLFPPIFLLLASLAHFTFHRRRARRAYQPSREGVDR
jgi:ABC-type uncharacterized transport system involved in gliding motility auxiliary subunit